MSYPPLLNLSTHQDYRKHFEEIYCRGPITTFDKISVRFRKSQFEHSFFESSNRNGVKDQFSTKRAERMDWIKATLQDENADRYKGWNNKKKKYDANRRVALVQGDFVVVIALTGKAKADFVTAFVADSGRTLSRIQQSPKWAN